MALEMFFEQGKGGAESIKYKGATGGAKGAEAPLPLTKSKLRKKIRSFNF